MSTEGLELDELSIAGRPLLFEGVICAEELETFTALEGGCLEHRADEQVAGTDVAECGFHSQLDPVARLSIQEPQRERNALAVETEERQAKKSHAGGPTGGITDEALRLRSRPDRGALGALPAACLDGESFVEQPVESLGLVVVLDCEVAALADSPRRPSKILPELAAQGRLVHLPACREIDEWTADVRSRERWFQRSFR